MAFKPFDFFRKRQKAMLAALAIMAMFLFVVGDAIFGRGSTGGGSSFAARLRRIFGAKDGVAKVQGETLDEQDLQDLFYQRRAVFQFLHEVEKTGMIAVYKEAGVSNEEAKFMADPEEARRNPEQARRASQRIMQLFNDRAFSEKVSNALKDVPSSLSSEVGRSNPSLDTEGLVEFAIWRKKADELGITISSDRVAEDLILVGRKRIKESDLARIAAQAPVRSNLGDLKDGVAEELRVMIARGTILGLQQQRPGMFGGFGSTPLSMQVTPFDLWQAYVKIKTDLKVSILPVPVSRDEFLSQVKQPSDEELKKFFEQHKKETPDATRDTPGFKIPELYRIEFIFADQKSQTTRNDYYRRFGEDVFAMTRSLSCALQPLGLPGASPIPAVSAANPASYHHEVLDRYDRDKIFRYRVDEPFAILVEPAKEGQLSYYRVPIPPAANARLLKITTIEQHQAAQQAAALAGLAAQTSLFPSLGTAGTLARPIGHPAPKEVQRQMQAREIAHALAGAPSGLPGLLSYPPRLGHIDHYKPLHSVMGGIEDELLDEKIRELLEADLNRLREDLRTYSSVYQEEHRRWRRQVRDAEDAGTKPPPFTPPPFKPQEVGTSLIGAATTAWPGFAPLYPAGQSPKEYLTDFANIRGLKYEGMAELRDKEHILKEKGKTPLNTFLRKLMYRVPGRRFGEEPKESDTENQIIEALISAKNPFEPRIAQPVGGPPNSQLDILLPLNKEYAIYWKAEVKEARIPEKDGVPQFDDPWPNFTGDKIESEVKVRDKVLAAWKMKEARSLAEEEAKKLAQKLKSLTPDDERVLKDQGYVYYNDEKLKLSRYSVDDTLSRYELPGMSRPGEKSVNYRKATPPVMEHPIDIDELMNKAEADLKQPGDTLVIANKPKTHYYAIVLRERKQPQPSDPKDVEAFDDAVIKAGPAGQLRVEHQTVGQHVVSERAREFQQKWEESLRKQARFDTEKAKQLDRFLQEQARDNR